MLGPTGAWGPPGLPTEQSKGLSRAGSNRSPGPGKAGAASLLLPSPLTRPRTKDPLQVLQLGDPFLRTGFALRDGGGKILSQRGGCHRGTQTRPAASLRLILVAASLRAAFSRALSPPRVQASTGKSREGKSSCSEQVPHVSSFRAIRKRLFS